MSDYFEVSYFQIENLVMNQVQFYFFDISGSKRDVADEPLKTLLHQTIPLEAHDVEPYLKEKADDLQVPIILMCNDGVVSARLAGQLSETGYINVNIVENGFEGLLEEAQSMTHS